MSAAVKCSLGDRLPSADRTSSVLSVLPTPGGPPLLFVPARPLLRLAAELRSPAATGLLLPGELLRPLAAELRLPVGPLPTGELKSLPLRSVPLPRSALL